jgi:hypothetical protein
MRISSLLLAGALLAGTASADATTPTVSGKYLIELTKVCGLAVHPWPTGVTTEFDGDYWSNTFAVSFNATTGHLSSAGYNADTQLIVPNSSGGNVSASSFTDHQIWSNTATTLTVGGQVYQAVYGDTKDGIVQHFEIAAILKTKGLKTANCVESGSASIY